MTTPRQLPLPPLQVIAQRAVARIEAQGFALDSDACSRLSQVAVASDFAIDVLERQPDLLAELLANADAPMRPPPTLADDAREDWPRLLRRYRSAESARLVWRDVLGLDTVEDTLAGSSRLAERCLTTALDALEAAFARQYGSVRTVNDAPRRLVVFALGKLGGGELNFSSDIDLIYAYDADGETAPAAGQEGGARALDPAQWFTRLAQQLTRLLDETTPDGFSHRVDLRLRPFGASGRMVWSFAALEQYFLAEGRDWERYAWQKARPVAGDIAAGEAFLQTLRPFVYRRYLDFGALDGMREMKAGIAAEVARRDREDDIKRGPGGIREIEFLAQALQMIHGGREASLRERALLPALRALQAARLMSDDAVQALAQAYRFLRRLENRLQMLRDAQTHVLPGDALDRVRIAHALGFSDWDALLRELQQQRAVVSTEFDALLAPRGAAPRADALQRYWRALPDGEDASALADAGFDDAAGVDAALRDFARGAGVRELSDASRARLDRVLPTMLHAAATAPAPDTTLRRVLALLQNILRRTSYLALLDEQPGALSRLVDALSRSAFLSQRIATTPLLLDELLDVRVSGPIPDADAMRAACREALNHLDPEAALLALNETRQALSFRIGLAALDHRQPASDSTRQLAWLADAVVEVVLALARRALVATHGDITALRFAVVGYGSLGSLELGFGSDIDLVFLYDLPGDAGSTESDGARPLDAARWAARLAQKIVALLGAPTSAGRLYDIDVRLRPDGGKGLLVSTLASYAEYQRERAWTWEHQALVRARCIAGDATLAADFDALRTEVLSRARAVESLRTDVDAMRQRMRAELDRSDGTRFDLKQGHGGLVDLEFLLQYLVLRDAHAHTALCVPRDTPGLIDAARTAGAIDTTLAERLQTAHATLLEAGLACMLDRRRRTVVPPDAVLRARDVVRSACASSCLTFE